MTSPASAHRQRIEAQQSQAAETEGRQDANAYELMLIQLAEDKRTLKTLQSTELKIAKKRELLPNYAPWIQGVLEGRQGVQDDVLMTVLVWLIDIGDFTAALQISAYALEFDLKLPDQFNRTLATLVAEEMADGALKICAQKQTPDIDALVQCQNLTENQDMPDQVRAKLHKALGLSLTESNPANALQQLQRALALHDKVGVKKEIEGLERVLKKAAANTTTEVTAEPTPGSQPDMAAGETAAA